MRYFKNSELTKLYNVSDKAIRNWIESAQQGKIDLDLCIVDKKTYIADTSDNLYKVELLVERGRKYRNKRSHKDIVPSMDFYKSFSVDEIVDIARSLDVDRELPWSYTFRGQGAIYWNQYLNKLRDAGTGNLITNTIETLEFNKSYFDRVISNYAHVNIINICVGNSVAIRDILTHIQATGKLQKVTLVDVNQDMIDISHANIREWTEGKIPIETQIRDVRRQSIGGFRGNTYGHDLSKTLNIFFLVAGPIVNFSNPDHLLHLIREDMGKEDILVTSLKRDTRQTRNFFDFHTKSDGNLLTPHDSLLLSLLNIQDSLYEVKQSFDETERRRSMKIRLKMDLSIHFAIEQFKHTVELKRGDYVSLWRSNHHTDARIISRLHRTNFNIQQISKSSDQQLILLISKIDTGGGTT